VPKKVLGRRKGRKAGKKPPRGILVLPREEGWPIFYYEAGLEEENHTSESPKPITTAAGLKTRFRRVVKGVSEAEDHAPRWLQSPIRWLKSRLPADERLLLSLRGAREAKLIHPTTLSAIEVDAAWAAYLDSQFRQRIGWLVFYLVVLVPSVMLTVVPGPNILGLWVTYRIIAHGIALFGISRSRRGKIAFKHVKSRELDGPVVTDRREANRVQEHFRLFGLMGRLKRDRVMARLRKRKQRAAEVTAGGGALR